MGKCDICGGGSTCRCSCERGLLCGNCFQEHLSRDPEGVHYCHQLAPTSPSRHSHEDVIISELDRISHRMETEATRLHSKLERLENDLLDLVRSQIQHCRSEIRHQVAATKTEIEALKKAVGKGKTGDSEMLKAFVTTPDIGLEALNQALDSFDVNTDEVLTALHSLRLSTPSIPVLLQQAYFSSLSIRLPNQRPLYFSVPRSVTVYTLKEICEKKTGVSARNVELKWGEVEMEGWRRVEELQIPQNAVLDGTIVETSRPVLYIQPYKQPRFTLDYDPSDTVLQLKSRISVLMDLPISNLRLIHMGRQLQDDTSHLKPNSYIFLAYASRQTLTLVIKTPSGKLIPVEISSHDTILSLKEVLSPLVELPVYGQSLFWNGRKLGNGETLEGCGVSNEAVLEVREGVDSLDAVKMMLQKKLQGLISATPGK